MARVRVTPAALAAISLAALAALAAAQAQTPAQKAPDAQKAPVAQKKPTAVKKKAGPAKADDQAAAKAQKADPEAAGKALETAQKSLDAGKAELAVNQIDALIGRGGLETRAMARALAIRGQAYRRLSKPAQAISDLQSALWLKSGLSDAERAAAQQARIEAYKEAGLPEPRAIGAPKAAAAAPAAPAGPKAAAVQAAPAKPAAPDVQTASIVRNPPRPESPAAAAAAGEPPAKAPAPPSQGGGVGAFLSNLFGAGQSKAPLANAPTAAPAALPPAPPGTKQPVVSASAPVVAKAAEPKGQYRLQLNAVRSRQEAQDMAARLKKEHGAALGERTWVIDEAVFGNMGTFYRVRIGPYADLTETKALCADLRRRGFDCMIITP
jgi:hypothetical protein